MVDLPTTCRRPARRFRSGLFHDSGLRIANARGLDAQLQGHSVEASTTMFSLTLLSQRIIGNFIRQAEFHLASYELKRIELGI